MVLSSLDEQGNKNDLVRGGSMIKDEERILF